MKSKTSVVLLALVALAAALPILAAEDSARPLVAATSEPESPAARPIDWKTLSEFLPKQIKGLLAGDIDGGTFTWGDPDDSEQTTNYSSVERDYSSENVLGRVRQITVRIVDCALNRMMLAPYIDTAEYDDSDGSLKAATIKGHPARLITELDNGRLERNRVILLVGNRILVMVEGNNQTTLEEMIKVAEKLDLDGLAMLTKQPAPGSR